jgi:hypothetical protein
MRLAARGTVQEQSSSDDRWLWRGLALGTVVAAAVLLRQVYLMFVPVLFLWMWWRSAGRQWRLMLAAALTLVAFILPFTIYNQLRFGQFVLLNTNAGFAFYWSNHPSYGDSFDPILDEQGYKRLIPNNLYALNEAALDQALLRLGLQFVVDDPGRYFRLTLSRIPVYFMFWPSPESSVISNFARVLSFGLMWPFMLFGLLRALRRPVWPAGPNSLGPVILLGGFGLCYAGIHLLSWALVRYRLPVDAMLLVFAGSAVVDLSRWLEPLRKSLWRRAEPRSAKS